MLKNTPLRLALPAVLAICLVACSNESGGGDSAPAASVSPSQASAAPSATPTQTPTTTPTASPTPAPPVTKVPTTAELTKALLALSDLPSGFSIEPDEGGGEDTGQLSSKDARCARFVALANAEKPPGSKASAYRSFSGGQDGPFIDEGLDAMGSAAAVQALQKSFRSAITSCRGVTLSIPGQGRSTMMVREVSAPPVGTTPVAVRMTATSGALEGLEVVLFSTGLDGVVLSLSVLAGAPDDLDGAADAGVTKARKILGGTKTGT
ncbi:hypothetical protein Kfla_1956 [Kribbella flavida DSM 17836]|uniref:PknH-like extracellular domain-containing protein n=1 Tax=Kribbella flavida (strain DSM 17836 / JCM 10339 / NBRC 14399) TaxID=479435 RepID=D2PQR7_KRIFD|nr:hypothetical protein [Kribbella flavida]ADB31050.1 hypothetical protein Kfla_1956 [Kribbella flavida DSM 17836]